MNILNDFEQKESKKTPKYLCEKCNFKTSKKIDWNRHIVTNKHQIMNNNDLLNHLNETVSPKTHKQYICGNCNKTYSARNGLWYHAKKCTNIQHNNTHFQNEQNNSIPFNLQDNKQKMNDELLIKLVMDVVKSNSEMQKQLLDIFQNGNFGNMNNSYNHSHNKTFNLQFFLNETCKDAMNIMDFVKDIKMTVSDLEDVGKLGYVDGITNIIVKNLKDIDVSKRPLHCSDLKREVLYVKDQDKWEKEDIDKEKLRYAIKHIAHKNIQMIPEWKKENPEYTNNEGYSNDQFMKIVMESMGGSDKKEENAYQDKIISKVAKHVIIEK